MAYECRREAGVVIETLKGEPSMRSDPGRFLIELFPSYRWLIRERRMPLLLLHKVMYRYTIAVYYPLERRRIGR